MSPGSPVDPLHPEPTRRSGYRYFFYSKHHGAASSSDARWLESVSQAEEFSVFDEADFHNIADARGWLYGVLRAAEDDLRDLGTWQQQVAEFPQAKAGVAWHGYPVWAVNGLAPANRAGQKMRPPSAVFQMMEQAGIITARERKRLIKGKHV